MAKLVIFGNADIARLAHFYFSHDSEHEVVAFTVDADYLKEDRLRGLPVVDFTNVPALYPPDRFKMFVAVSYAKMNRIRAAKFHAVKDLGYQCVSYVSSRCSFLTDTPVGENCFIQEDNTIQPFAVIGSNVTLWAGNHIGHDCVIEDHCFVSSHVVVSGYVRVGEYSFLGVNSTIGHKVKIAPRTLVGAGAVITRDTKERGIYVPARPTLLAKSSDDVDI